MITQIQKIFFLLLATFFYEATIAQCSSSGAKAGTTFLNNTSIGKIAWTLPANAKSSDNIRTDASEIVSIPYSSDTTNYIRISGFGFSLPADATICGIEVRIEHRQEGVVIGSSVKDGVVKLIKGAKLCNKNKASNTSWASTDEVFTYGNPADLWLTTWTPAEINAANFGVAIAAAVLSKIVPLALSPEIDYVSITVYYNNFVLPIELTDFIAGKTDNEKVDLTWKTLSEKNNNYFEIERSKDALSFEQVKTVKGAGNSIQTIQYASSDENPYAGLSYYRLKQVDYNGTYTYSDIREVTFKEKSAITLYPVPASDKLNIRLDNKEDSQIEITLINTMGQKVKTYAQNMQKGSNEMLLNIEDISEGFYVVRINTPWEERHQKIHIIK